MKWKFSAGLTRSGSYDRQPGDKAERGGSETRCSSLLTAYEARFTRGVRYYHEETLTYELCPAGQELSS